MKRLLIYIFLLFAAQLHAQDYEISLQHWDTKDGLNYRWVRSLCQDKRGFIWVGTQTGLNRFDGYTFKVFTKEKDGVPFSYYGDIQEDTRGCLWLQGPQQRKDNLAIYDPLSKKSFSFKEYTGYSENIHINFLQKINDTTLFFASNDDNFFFTWTPVNGLRKIIYPVHPVYVPLPAVGNKLTIKITAHSTFFVQNDSGEVCEINMQGTLLRKVRTPFIINWKQPIIQHGDVFISNKDVKNIYSMADNMEIKNADSTLPAWDSTFQDIVFSTGIDDIIYRQGKLWQPRKGLLADFIKDGRPELKKYFSDILVDKLGRIWMGNDYGLYMLTITKSKFRKFFYQDPRIFDKNSYRNIVLWNGKLFAANEFDGIATADLTTGKTVTDFIPPNKVVGYYNLIKTTEGELLGLVQNSQLYYRRKDNRWQYFKLQQTTETYNCWKIAQVTSDSFLLGTGGGLEWLKLDRAAPQKSTLAPFNRYNGFNDLASAIVEDILPAGDGTCWICSNTGLFIWDAAHGITARYSSRDTGSHLLPSEEFQHLYKDTGNLYWLATTNGLLRWDRKHNTYRLFTRNDGLSNNNIYAVYDDGLGNLWLSSDYGIMKFNKSTYKIRTYQTTDGISYNEFNRVSHLQDPAGNLYFGSLNGITSFNPKDFVGDDGGEEKGAYLAITMCEQFSGEKNRLQEISESVVHNHTIILEPGDRFFNINFALLNYTDVLHNTYYWKIDELDSGWTSTRETALRLSGFPYGKFHLRIKAQSNDGSWSRNELHIEITNIKPFYLRAWFILLSILLLVWIIIGIYRWRVFLLKKENERLDKIVKEKTFALENTINDLELSSRQKDVLMKEIHHRVKNNLQVISTLLDLQLKNIKEESARKSIEEGIARISSIALIHHHLYKGENLVAIEIADFAQELEQQVSSVYHTDRQRIQLQNEIPKTYLDIDTAIPIGLILNELMTNSYKYAFKNTDNCRITLRLTHKDDHYTLLYSDNGPGLPADVDINNVKSLGVTIIKNLSKQLGGSFEYSRAGNCFIITFKDLAARKNIA